MRRWLQVAAVAAFINTSYGTLSYAFSVLVTRSAAGGEFGPGAVSLGFGLALLVSGGAAIGAGTIADLFGTRRLMAGGAVVGAAGLALLGLCQEPWQAIALMAVVLGPAMAATFYDPVYVLMNRWFAPHERGRAYGVLTFLSGFSITIFTPLTRWLVNGLGWEQAVLVLGIILLVVGTAVPALIREPPAERSPTAPLSARAFLSEARDGLRHGDMPFWAFSGAFFVATAAFSGFQFHMVAQLETRGFDDVAVANAIAVTGIVSLPGRLLLPALTGRWPSPLLLLICLVSLGGAAMVASGASAWWHVWVYVAVFGAVFGAVYPLRALVTAERWSGPYFGRLIGVQALFVAVARATGPALIGLAAADRASYALAFQIAGAVLLVSAIAAWAIVRTRPRQTDATAPA